MAVVKNSSPAEVSQLVNTTGVDLVLSDLLESNSGGWFECSLYLFPAISPSWNKYRFCVCENKPVGAKWYIRGDYFTWISVGVERIKAIETLHPQQRSLGWGLGAAQRDQLSKLAKTPSLIRLYQLLLFTMPGTPVFTYGDEIGLQAQVSNKWTRSVHIFEQPYSFHRV